MTKSNKKTTAIIVGILAALAFLLTGILVFMPSKPNTAKAAGVTKGKVLYLVDAGYVVDSITGEGTIVGRDNDGTPHPSKKGSQNYVDYGLTDANGYIAGGLYNSVTDQPFGADASTLKVSADEGAATMTGTGYEWGYIATTGAGSSEAAGGGQGDRWCTANTGDSFGFTTARLMEGKFFGTLTYKFEIPAEDAVTDSVNNKFTVSFGLKNLSGWGYNLKVSANGGTPIEVKDSAPQDLYTITDVEAVDEGGKKYISLLFDTENTNSNIFVNWIMVATPDAELTSNTIGRKSIAKGDTQINAIVQKFGETSGVESKVDLSEQSKTDLANAEVLSKVNLTLVDGTAVNDVLVLPEKTKHFINIGDVNGGDNAYMIADGAYSDERGCGYDTPAIDQTWVNSTFDTTIRHSQDDMAYKFKVESGKSYGVIAGAWGGGDGWGSRTMALSVSSDGSTYTEKAELPATQQATSKESFFADAESTELYIKFSKKTGGAATPAYLIVYEVNKLTFDMQGHGEQVAPAYFQGTYNDYSAAPTATGYTFGGWFKDTAGTQAAEAVTESSTVYASWTKDTYNITYELDGGTNAAGNAATYQYGDTVTLDDPTKTVAGEKWRFDGWYTDAGFAAESKITEIAATETGNKTVYAKWVQQFTVTYHIDTNTEGTIQGDAPAAVTVDTGATVAMPTVTATLTGYEISGWYTDNTLNNVFAFSTPITADTDLYAKWTSTANMKTVTYYMNGDTEGEVYGTPQQVAENTAITNFPTDPTRANYDFGGWYKDAACSGEAVTVNEVVTDDLSLYAKWTLKKYNVTFNSGCDTTVPAQQVEHGSHATKPDTALVNGGKVLMGWYTDNTFATEFDFATQDITADTTVYARWATVAVGRFLNKGATSITAVADDKTGVYFEIELSDADKAKMAAAEVWTEVTLDPVYNGTAIGSSTVVVTPKSTAYFVNFGEFPGAADWNQPKDNPVPNGYRAYTADLGYGFTEIKDMNSGSKKPEVALGQGDGTYKQTILLNFEKLVYQFDNLVAGKYYKVVLGHYNPWGTRPIVVTTANVSDGALSAKSYDIPGGASENTFTVRIADGQTSLKLTMAKASNKDHPIISYMYLYEVGRAAYNVNYDGAADEEVWLEAGEEYELPTDIVRNGYEFIGWNTSSDGTGEAITGGKIATGTTAYAQWQAAAFSITYVLPDGATNPNATTTTYTFGSTYIFQAATLEGYEFVGWYYPLDDTTPITEITATDYGDITLEARFVRLHTVTFDINNADASAPTAPAIIENLKSGIDKATAPTAPIDFTGADSKDYRFVGWYTEAECINAYDFDAVVTADITLYAKWVTGYKVIFVTNGGSEIADLELSFTDAQGSIDLTDKTTARTGYTFGGWYADEDLTTAFDGTSGITADTKVYAKWNAVDVTVVFNSKDGSAVSNYVGKFDGRVAKPEDPTKEGFIFGGWFKDEACTVAFDFINERITSTEDITLYAKWAQPQVTVKFDTDGGSAAANVSVIKGGTLDALPTVTKTGYTFADWYTDKALTAKFDKTVAITADTTLYAKWTINKYTVSFNVNGGSEVAAQTVEFNGVAVKPEADPTKAGHVFAGWCSDEALTVAFDFTSNITADTTVYAKWVKQTFTVSFNVAGGSAVAAATGIESGSKVTKPADPTKDGYKFEGWFADEACTVAFDFEAGITADTTVYAKWTESSGGCGSTVSSTAVGAGAVILMGLIVLAVVLLNKKRAR